MWKNPFKKVPAAAVVSVPAASTLKERVAAFWSWYSGVAGGFYAAIEDRRCAELEAAVSSKVDELLPGFGWVFGPGADGKGHSFTLTPEGNPHKRLAAHYWLGQAPILEGWTFYAARQPDKPFRTGRHFKIDGMDFKAKEIWLTPWVDEQQETVDIMVWHPLFATIQESLRHTVTLLWLDEVLGEEGTANWIGEIKLGDQLLTDAMPLSELPDFIEELQSRQGWKKYPPHQTMSAYRMEEPETGSLREDIIAGSSLLMSLVNRYPLEENPLEHLGAEYFMIAFPADRFPTGRQVEVRGEIEDAITAAFEKEASGKVLGGAGGLEYYYIDLVFYDGIRSRKILEQVLIEQGFGAVARLHSFVVPAK